MHPPAGAFWLKWGGAGGWRRDAVGAQAEGRVREGLQNERQ